MECRSSRPFGGVSESPGLFGPTLFCLGKKSMQNVDFYLFAISCNCKISAAPLGPLHCGASVGWTDSSRLELMLRFAAVSWTKFWCGEAPFVELSWLATCGKLPLKNTHGFGSFF